MLIVRVFCLLALFGSMLALPIWAQSAIGSSSLATHWISDFRVSAQEEPTAGDPDKNHRGGNDRGETDDPERNNRRTNKLGADGFEIEGEVIRTHCSRKPPEVIIGALDGEVTIRVMKNKKESLNFNCEWVHKGDYLFVEFAEKQHEHLYDGYEFELEGEHENENDNEDEEHGHHGGHAHDSADDKHGGHEHDHQHEAFEVTLNLDGGSAGRLAAPDDLVMLEIQPSAIPGPVVFSLRSTDEHPATEPPGEHVAEILFELTVREGSVDLSRLPGAVTMTVNYHDEDAEGLDERRFALAVWDISSNQWIPVPSTPLPAENRIVSNTNRPGVYALYQRQ